MLHLTAIQPNCVSLHYIIQTNTFLLILTSYSLTPRCISLHYIVQSYSLHSTVHPCFSGDWHLDGGMYCLCLCCPHRVHCGQLPLEEGQSVSKKVSRLLYGEVWYNMVCYGMVWYGVLWYAVVWYGLVWYCMVWYGKSSHPAKTQYIIHWSIISSPGPTYPCL